MEWNGEDGEMGGGGSKDGLWFLMSGDCEYGVEGIMVVGWVFGCGLRNCFCTSLLRNNGDMLS